MRFLPREEKFFALFLDQVRIISDAAALLLEGAQAGDAHLAQNAVKIKALEEKADAVIHDIYLRLNQTFITPLDPEDIHSLSSHLDDVIDGIEDAVHRMVAYRLNPIPPTVVDVCKHIVACVNSLTLAFEALHSNKKLIEHCIEINRVEELVDNLVRDAVKNLFETETDPIKVIKLKEIYEFLELTTDNCEDVADALQNVVVKNS
jgi:predicted phosphate transport protein (TIGR00153 family)